MHMFFFAKHFMFLMSLMRGTGRGGGKPHSAFQMRMKIILNVFLVQVAFGCVMKEVYSTTQSFQVFKSHLLASSSVRPRAS